ncbi:efflux RND transporter periplasmic adaptor subunit [Waterburya agarophytonicola K14]|uniref:Efflux RND transporter periplasmic adaptor subunit n=1 Tax=Waterburya agarophytonicola KI4 TaxID=2874699 RepID=A0A964BP01_9CYAN|nr:HlyD family efflux transporter periplasmic adaptor subunit [Waterburya agarophytonicola]MCC0175516.1 efflux RND transporter periplasmic adaptor subunit [Waterburya agarophytonicola KI4]
MKSTINQKSKHYPVVATGLVALCLALIGFTSYSLVKGSNKKIDLNALTVEVKQEDLNVEIAASGRIEPIKSVNVSPKDPARLVKLLVEQGDRVTAGQTLAIMENKELANQISRSQAELKQNSADFAEGKAKINAEIAQAQARLRQAEARLNGVQNRIPKDIEQTQSQINAAQSRLKLVRERLKRNEYLLQQGAITQDAFDEISNDYQNALSNINELRQRLEQFQTTGGSEVEQIKAEIKEASLNLEQKRKTAPDEIVSLEASLEQAQVSVQQSQIQYNDSIVKAPFDGIVTQRYAVEGSFVAPSTSGSSTASASANSILALAQGLEVIAKVAELDIGQLQPGQKVIIVADAYPDREFKGEIKRIAPEAIIEENVTSFEVRVKLLTGQEILRSKMNVDVTFIGEELSDSLVVPTVAIFTQDGEQGVMVPDATNKPKFKPVKVGLYLGNKTQIIEGVEAQDKVFIDLPEKKRRGKQN